MREIKVVMHDIREEVPPVSGNYIVTLHFGGHPIRYTNMSFSVRHNKFNALDKEENPVNAFEDARTAMIDPYEHYIVEWAEFPEGGTWT